MTPRTLQDPNAIPQELFPRRQFVCWQSVPDPKGGKDQKQPINPKTRGGAGYKWPNTWADIYTATATYLAYTHLSGIGFMLTENDAYANVDVDNCLIDGEASPLALQVANLLHTYAEISPSGRGLRFIIRCWPLPGNHAQPNSIELYSRQKFATLTGRVWRERLPIAQVDNVVELLKPFLGERKRTHSDPPVFFEGTRPDADDNALWQRIFAKNQLAYKLFHGDLSGVHGQGKHGGPDGSRAVILLLNSLAFWTNGDAARMATMIRQTQLDKTRWDDKRGNGTWLDYQIADACQYMGGKVRR